MTLTDLLAGVDWSQMEVLVNGFIRSRHATCPLEIATGSMFYTSRAETLTGIDFDSLGRYVLNAADNIINSPISARWRQHFLESMAVAKVRASQGADR